MINKPNTIPEFYLKDLTIPLFKVKPIYAIKEVSEIIKEKPYVIRFWESEFKDFIKPMRGRGNRRLYRKSDIEMLLQIKHLLKVKKFTISGAKRILRVKDSRELIKEEALTPSSADKLRFLTEQMRLLIDEMITLRDGLLRILD
ncbi:MAG: MerR family transcriptional regulator [Deltaproteobacteria bacterium]|nr:MerR family transcriptional regulator [Deltaproteobacteria bacterium]